MQFTSQELRYFHHKYRGGKSIPAHILDCTLGAILLWALLFFALRFFGAPWRGALLLGLCLCISLGSFVAILWRYRFQRFLSRELARLRCGVSLESLTLLPEAEYEAICRQLFAAAPIAGTITRKKPAFAMPFTTTRRRRSASAK